MPKGQQGCYRCGRPTEQIVQIWMREYTEETYANHCRKERSVASENRSFCAPCAEVTYNECAKALATELRSRGCRYCGKKRAERRVQVWRRGSESNQSTGTAGGSYCEPCAVMAYDFLQAELTG